jgi:hypothetical protein
MTLLFQKAEQKNQVAQNQAFRKITGIYSSQIHLKQVEFILINPKRDPT